MANKKRSAGVLSGGALTEDEAAFVASGANAAPFNSGPPHESDEENGANSDDPIVVAEKLLLKKKRKLNLYVRELFPSILDHGVFLFVNIDNEIDAIPSEFSDVWSVEYFKDDTNA